MITHHPVVSLEVLKHMYPNFEPETLALASSGYWYWSVENKRFQVYVPEAQVSVYDITPPQSSVTHHPEFLLRKYSSVYEVSDKNRFPSGLLLASNFVNLVEEHMDCNEDLHVAVVNNPTVPILLGSFRALKRLMMTVPETDYCINPVVDYYMEGGQEHVR